jgi:formylglycine-generating enzyme required for sulfatase activity
MTSSSDTRDRFDHLVKELTDEAVDHARRASIGDHLAALGDRRYGVGVSGNGIPEIAWCLVDVPELREKRKITTAQIEEPGLGLLPVVLPFSIAKYPITYAQMLAFYEAENGYRQDHWWEGMAIPKKMWEQDAEVANYPAENMNWYTAVAFCRWLSQQVGFMVRLPTEAEWWLAATLGDRTRLYPWGSDWNEIYANTKEGGLGHTTAVGTFPGGAAPCGALDMIGNVWEWCANEAETPGTIDLRSGWWKASRGGSFMDSKQINVLSRYNVSAINSFAFRGFRIVRSGEDAKQYLSS